MMQRIQTTTNYGMFKDMNNRVLKAHHVEYLKNEIKVDGLLIPIIVDKRMRVIDGQHRLEALKQLNEQVEYIVRPNAAPSTMIRVNTSQMSWTLLDYLKWYCDKGNHDYLLLRKFMDEFEGIKLMPARNLLTLNNNNISQQFKDGEFKVTQYDKGVEIASYLWQYAEDYEKPFVKSTRFIYGYMRVYKLLFLEGRVNELHHAMEEHSRRIVKCHSNREVAEMLVEQFNYRRRKDKIRLDD